MVLIYWPDQGQHTHILSGSHRKDGKQSVRIDANLANERVEAYISFVNDDATKISDSVYAGSIAKNGAIKIIEQAAEVIKHKTIKSQVESNRNTSIPKKRDLPALFSYLKGIRIISPPFPVLVSPISRLTILFRQPDSDIIPDTLFKKRSLSQIVISYAEGTINPLFS